MDWYMDWSNDFIGSHFISGIIPANKGLQAILGKHDNAIIGWVLLHTHTHTHTPTHHTPTHAHTKERERT